MFHRRAGGVGGEVVVALPVPGGADGAGREAAAAVGADVHEEDFGAMRAKSALVGTDAGVGQRGREGAVAVLAGRSESEHADD